MPGRTGGSVARLFERISRFFQPFANSPFGSLCAMLDRLARFCGSFLNRFTGFFDRTLIFGSRRQRYGK